MKISTILDHIDNGHMALPEFQRGYVWNSEQVRGLFDSLYRRHPVGGLLVWATDSSTAKHRGDGELASGIVKLLLDGQQRMTSLYGVIRGKPPKFFDGNSGAFTGLRFHLESQTFEFHQAIKMKDDPLWVDVSDLMKQGNAGMGAHITRLSSRPELAAGIGDYVARLSRVLGIADIDLHIEEVTGADKSLDVVVDIFNRVNSGGTKLSKGDLALAKICADWPEGRDSMKARLKEWSRADYAFTLDWLLRSINTVLTGEAKFQHLHEKGAGEIRDALAKAAKHIDTSLNMIAGRLGLDHDRVLFARFAVPVMVRYLDQRQQKKLGPLDEKERDKLLFWYFQAGMWGRFSGSVESYIDQDLAAVEEGGLDRLLEQLRLWHGGLRTEPAHFTGWSSGARFYPVLYMLTRVGEARDWGSGIALRANLLGKMNKLEVHHIFPKAQLYKRKFKKPEVNALGNFCFLTKGTNLDISDALPEIYFAEIEKRHPGALASQWIPMDRDLWKIDRYREFLEARKALLAAELNKRLEELLHGDARWLAGPSAPVIAEAVGKAASGEEEAELAALNDWMGSKGLPEGQVAYELVDVQTGEQKAVFDLAWPSGIQEELSQPVALLLDEEAAVFSLASQAGFRCFMDVPSFKRYVEADVLQEANPLQLSTP
ncbi:GmrSD restriction endonuclease domain-containing protein [Dokdonella ginsengisoli]|uniref:DUF262 domain-containing protein n=1 Tax=Dokdonella ginsengisoli TaxID=363846 RepID=A0ABV9QZC6_9GAMM